MTLFTKLPTQALAIGLFAFVGMTAANPIAHLVDCSDSFWAIACADGGQGDNGDEGAGDGGNSDSSDSGEQEPEIILGEPVAIDSDPVCAEIEGGFIVCHT